MDISPTKFFKSQSPSLGWRSLLIYPLAVVWPSGWVGVHAPYQSHLFMMIVAVYATLGIFL